ncbi:Seroin [Eumeta japonica]|uniref:Seroin n=1 Tax=Eumeta variegata TaxID=151549 RepID=A0A4C2AEB3_EUMVA|nr:Seroin [Eumeta japonica]
MALLNLVVVALVATSLWFNSPPFVNFPSFPDIANVKPAPGASFNGVSASSVSRTVTDKDGNVKHTGGSTVVTNDNGKVNKYTS